MKAISQTEIVGTMSWGVGAAEVLLDQIVLIQ